LIQTEDKGFTKCYATIALIALRNGSRIGEAIEAFREFLKTSKVRIYVRVKKHKKEDYRLMIIPKELVEEDLSMCTPLIGKDKDIIRSNANRYLHRRLGINAHSLRYAFITYMLRKGVSPSIIATITGHKNLNMILKYTERKERRRFWRSSHECYVHLHGQAQRGSRSAQLSNLFACFKTLL